MKSSEQQPKTALIEVHCMEAGCYETSCIPLIENWEQHEDGTWTCLYCKEQLIADSMVGPQS